MKKITSIVITFLLFCSAYADTINSASKNTSVAVYGTQRTSTAIQPWVIPVAVAGAACNSTTDIVAVTSDHSSQLICQSGTWAAIGGGGLGYGQSWQDLTSSRALYTNYINSTGKPILVSMRVTTNGGTSDAVILVDGVAVKGTVPDGGVAWSAHACVAVVPNGSVYSAGRSSGSGGAVNYWVELR